MDFLLRQNPDLTGIINSVKEERKDVQGEVLDKTIKGALEPVRNLEGEVVIPPQHVTVYLKKYLEDRHPIKRERP